MHTKPGARRLAREPSPYLREAAHQPVDWHPWGDEAFSKAKRDGKPLLVDSGAVWCHWCHVMDHESYADPELARLINELFVPVKLDRDERPDVDGRLQQAVGLLTGHGGWPLTAFLTPDGDVYFGGTYFPPRPAHGMPAFREVLEAAARFYRESGDKAREQAGHIRDAVARAAPAGGGALADDLAEEAVAGILATYDPVNGGFGRAPKFPHAAALDLLMMAAQRGGVMHNAAQEAALHTLLAMGRGGVYDQLAGGFHRYSVDGEWRVPHFEKMLYDNACLLRSYSFAAALSRERGLGEAMELEAKAREIARFMVGTLGQPGGGIGGSQDADVRPAKDGPLTQRDLDDGDHFTWTLAEARAALAVDELRVARLHWDIGEEGEMHHDRARNVLFVAAGAEEIAAGTGLAIGRVNELLSIARRKLLAARAKRPTPYVDPTVYASWNGMAIEALLTWHALHGDRDAREAALRAVDLLLACAWRDGEGFAHAVTDGRARVGGLLDDQAQMIPALIAAHHATQDGRYLDAARRTADVVLARYVLADGRLRSAERAHETAALADQPTPAAAAQALVHLPRLSRLMGDERYAAAAERALASYAGEAERLTNVFGATLHIAIALRAAAPAHVVVIGSGRTADELFTATCKVFAPFSTVLRVADVGATGVPPEAREAARAFAGSAVAIVCRGTTCRVARTASEVAPAMTGA